MVKYSKTEFFVGLFMLLGIIAGVVLALKVAGLTLSYDTGVYTIHGYFDNVGSLKAAWLSAGSPPSMLIRKSWCR